MEGSHLVKLWNVLDLDKWNRERRMWIKSAKMMNDWAEV
jgi:hypothetical protein